MSLSHHVDVTEKPSASHKIPQLHHERFLQGAARYVTPSSFKTLLPFKKAHARFGQALRAVKSRIMFASPPLVYLDCVITSVPVIMY